MTQPLTLSSGPSFWRRRTAGGRAGILLLRAAIGLGVIIGLIEAIGGGSVTRVYAWTLAVMILGAGIIRAIACWRRGGAWECRIDEEMMVLSRSGEPPLVIDTGEIRQWIQRRSDGGGDLSAETAESHELKLRDGRIVRLDDYPFGRLGPLRKFLQRANPEMQIVKIHDQAPSAVVAMRSAAEPK